ncbi:MAG: class I SAM-dependent methyltransferase [Woeseiaceae bacterium]
MNKSPISISYTSDDLKEKAGNFAKSAGYPLVPKNEVTTPINLNYTHDFVELCDHEKNISIHIDFISGDLAHRQKYGGGRGQSIAKAIGLKQGSPPPSVLDATAGLAKDAYVLACLGCSMTLIERSPIIVELIKDAIHRSEEDGHFKTILETGFNVINQSSIEYLTELANKTLLETDALEMIDPDVIYPEVIYLDPMYPDKKKSASVKKNMQILQKLLGKDEDTQELLNVALKVAKKRVVVKRPKGAKNLSELKPTYAVESKKTRYDVYIIQK